MAQVAAACLLLSLSCLIQFANALDVTGRVQWNDICPSYEKVRGASAVLDNGRWSGSIRRDGVFTLADVEPGTYLINVISHDFVFDPLRIDVSNAEPYVSVYAYVPGTPLLSPTPLLKTGFPIILSAKAKNDYFVEHEAFDPLAMFKSPLMMIVVATAVLIFAMPRLMSSMDPETLKEVQDRHSKIMSAQNSLSNMDVGGLASMLGGSEGAQSTHQQSTKPSTNTPGRGKPKGRKR